MSELIAKLFDCIGSFGPYVQFGLGAVTGCLTGFSLMKISKLAIGALGGAIIIVKIAEIEGLLDVDWMNIKENMQRFAIDKNVTSANSGKIATNTENFLIPLFGGGLIGIGFS